MHTCTSWSSTCINYFTNLFIIKLVIKLIIIINIITIHYYYYYYVIQLNVQFHLIIAVIMVRNVFELDHTVDTKIYK